MALVLALLLFGYADSKIPTDAEIAAQIETVIRQQLHPKSVQVEVDRRSSLSTTMQRLDINISGFTVDTLPVAVAKPAPTAPDTEPAPRRLRARRVRDDKQLRIMRLNLRCRDLVAKGLPFAALDLHMREVWTPVESLRGGALTITAAERIYGEAVFTETELTRYLRTLALPLRKLTIAIDRDTVTIKGQTTTFVSVPVEITGALRVKDGSVIYLEDPKLRVSVIGVPEVISDRLLKSLNPLLDLSKVLGPTVPVEITGITQQQGIVRLGVEIEAPNTKE